MTIAARAWLADYDRTWLRPDIMAGITLAAYLLPAGLGDASLAGLPPEAGLYACLFGGLGFWLFCSSRHTVVGNDSHQAGAEKLRPPHTTKPNVEVVEGRVVGVAIGAPRDVGEVVPTTAPHYTDGTFRRPARVGLRIA